jgi:hypothetical protein
MNTWTHDSATIVGCRVYVHMLGAGPRCCSNGSIGRGETWRQTNFFPRINGRSHKCFPLIHISQRKSFVRITLVLLINVNTERSVQRIVYYRCLTIWSSVVFTRVNRRPVFFKLLDSLIKWINYTDKKNSNKFEI